jgi:uncharacterized protein (TIGR03435 family)
MRFAAVGWVRGLILAGVVPISIAAGQTVSPATNAAKPAADAGGAHIATQSAPEFEVATIKPSDPARCCDRTFNEYGRRLQSLNTNLKWMIQWAYSVQPNQIVGGPAWVDVDRYDVAGELDGTAVPANLQWRAAVQKLLADRFQLQFHHETREMPAYALVVAKGGSKLVKDDDDTMPEATGFGGSPGHTMNGFGRNVTISQFFGELQRLATDLPIVDRTGLTGTFKIQLSFTREDLQSVGMTVLPDNAAPNIFDALQQQLGLKLEKVKAQVDVLVIDHAEPPSAN